MPSNEQWGDQVIDINPGLGNHAAQSRGAAQAPEASLGKGHGAMLRGLTRKCVHKRTQLSELDIQQRLHDEIGSGEILHLGDPIGCNHAHHAGRLRRGTSVE